MTDFLQHVHQSFSQGKKDFEEMNKPTKEDTQMNGLEYNVQPLPVGGGLKVYNLGQDPSEPDINQYVLELGTGFKQYLRLRYGISKAAGKQWGQSVVKGQPYYDVQWISNANVGGHINDIIESQVPKTTSDHHDLMNTQLEEDEGAWCDLCDGYVVNCKHDDLDVDQ
jgi:hypothetical protein